MGTVMGTEGGPCLGQAAQGTVTTRNSGMERGSTSGLVFQQREGGRAFPALPAPAQPWDQPSKGNVTETQPEPHAQPCWPSGSPARCVPAPGAGAGL